MSIEPRQPFAKVHEPSNVTRNSMLKTIRVESMNPVSFSVLRQKSTLRRVSIGFWRVCGEESEEAIDGHSVVVDLIVKLHLGSLAARLVCITSLREEQ